MAVGLVLISAGVAGLVADAGSEHTSVETQSGSITAEIQGGNDTAVDETTDPTEEPYIEPVPERGDPYFEAEASDGSWISYVNPRDEYRDPYLGDGSGKLCVSLYNADGEVVVGETVPDTTVTIPTGDSLDWHTSADPFVVEYPLTDHYERPLDADQFGTDPDLPQGDGYLDSHCMEIHGMPSDGTIEYGEAEIDGEYADRIDLVGYIQEDGQAWDSDVDPLGDAVSYEESGGGWTYEPGNSHGQMVVVLQLDHGGAGTEEDDDPASSDTDTADDGADETDQDDGEPTEQDVDNGDTEGGTDGSDGDDSLAGFGMIAAAVALLGVAVFARCQ